MFDAFHAPTVTQDILSGPRSLRIARGQDGVKKKISNVKEEGTKGKKD